MDYDSYVHNQTVVHGQIEKPPQYHEAERKAIDHLFRDIPKKSRILDVGCGSGLGMKYLRELGYQSVEGIELHPEKARIAGAYFGDVATFSFRHTYDLIYCSHAFEHMYDPHAALLNMKAIADGFIFILPYVDTGDPVAHLASFEIGTRVDDAGETVNNWFTSRGLILIEKAFSKLREPEIWLRYAI